MNTTNINITNPPEEKEVDTTSLETVPITLKETVALHDGSAFRYEYAFELPVDIYEMLEELVELDSNYKSIDSYIKKKLLELTFNDSNIFSNIIIQEHMFLKLLEEEDIDTTEAETIPVTVTLKEESTDPNTSYTQNVSLELPVEIHRKLERIIELNPNYDSIDTYINKINRGKTWNINYYIYQIKTDYDRTILEGLKLRTEIPLLEKQLSKLENQLTKEEKIEFRVEL